jgi:hypothetical protein
MSLYMLDYIDDPDMRSNVHRSLAQPSEMDGSPEIDMYRS